MSAHRDFPGGEGESTFTGRASLADVYTSEARRILGLEPYDIPAVATPGAMQVLKIANAVQSEGDIQGVA